MNKETRHLPTHKVHNFPVFLALKERKLLLIGGGDSAARKLPRLLDSGAKLVVIAPQLSATLNAQLEVQPYNYQAREWQASDFQPGILVVAATDDPDIDRAICEAAHTAGCWVNVASQPAISSFLIPSLIDRAPLRVAVSSDGSSPVLARLLSARIDAFLPQSYRDLGKFVQRFKDQVALHIDTAHKRRRFWERILSGRIGEMILQGQQQSAERTLINAIKDEQLHPDEGEVYLVGAGPGDPDLLSFRALRLMQQCDIVLYDRLVSEPIMNLVSADAERVYVGKQRNDHAVPQDSINALLVKYAREGKRVLRLKGGDPFIFGRGGEEIETLAAQDVPFQVVPGITAAAGCASYAGIPLTHRDYAQVCLFVTGHLKDGTVNLDWQALTRPHQTVVIYMGLVGLSVICQQLIAHGLPETHPIAIIAQGTRSNQQVLTGTLATMSELVNPELIKPPTLIIVGEVVKLRDKLAWFEDRG